MNNNKEKKDEAEEITDVDVFGTVAFIYTNKLRRIPIEPRYLQNIIEDLSGRILGRKIHYENEVLFFDDISYPRWDEYRQQGLGVI